MEFGFFPWFCDVFGDNILVFYACNGTQVLEKHSDILKLIWTNLFVIFQLVCGKLQSSGDLSVILVLHVYEWPQDIVQDIFHYNTT